MEFYKGTYKDFLRVKEIYKEAFPRYERKPVFMQKNKIKKGDYNIHLLEDNGEILGFMTSVKYNNIVMLDYLAVNSKVRSRGAGTEILLRVSEEYKDYTTFLMCEPLDDTAENNEQRIKRKNFYHKNGFMENGIVVNGISGRMDLMMKNGTMTPKDYIDLQTFAIGKFLMKFGNIHVEKE